MLLTNHIPSEVFEVFNDLIVKNWNGKSAKVLQTEVKCFFDIEDHYRKAGWSVNYFTPDMREDYEPYFLFVKNKIARLYPINAVILSHVSSFSQAKRPSLLFGFNHQKT